MLDYLVEPKYESYPLTLLDAFSRASLGDNWTILCEKNKKEWFRGSKIQMVHTDTNRYLHSANNLKFTPQNCGQGCPIMNQNEVNHCCLLCDVHMCYPISCFVYSLIL